MFAMMFVKIDREMYDRARELLGKLQAYTLQNPDAPSSTMAYVVGQVIALLTVAEPSGVDYAKALFAYRRKLGMNQGELARRLGVSQTAVSAVERGEKNPSRKTAMLIDAYFVANGIDPEALTNKP